jgi:Protein of unknown function (DUF4238)
MSRYKNNHYVPKWLLKNFRDENERLFYYDKRDPSTSVKHRNLDRIFSSADLYVSKNQNGERDVSLEKDHFQDLETQFQPVIEKIISAARLRKLPQLNNDEKKVWDSFLSNMWSRSPDFYNSVFTSEVLDKMYFENIIELEAMVCTLSETKKQDLLSAEVKGRVQKTAYVDSLRDGLDLPKQALSKRGIVIAVAKDVRSSFIVGSFPVVKLTFPKQTSLLDLSVEVWISISHDVAVSIFGHNGQEKVVEIDAQQVKSLNDNIYSQSQEIAGKSDLLVESYAKRYRKSLRFGRELQ